jgi:hypothetical protein
MRSGRSPTRRPAPTRVLARPVQRRPLGTGRPTWGDASPHRPWVGGRPPKARAPRGAAPPTWWPEPPGRRMAPRPGRALRAEARRQAAMIGRSPGQCAGRWARRWSWASRAQEISAAAHRSARRPPGARPSIADGARIPSAGRDEGPSLGTLPKLRSCPDERLEHGVSPGWCGRGAARPGAECVVRQVAHGDRAPAGPPGPARDASGPVRARRGRGGGRATAVWPPETVTRSGHAAAAA